MAYSPTTGAAIEVTDGTSSETTGYDSWGRVVSYADSSGNTATTTYNTAGDVATFSDGKGTYTYAYDGTDARGKKERRSLVTAVDVDLDGVGADEFTGAYDANGELVEQHYPGGLEAYWTYDLDGNVTDLSYVQDGEGLLGFSQAFDHAGKVRNSSGPISSQSYVYDDKERLVEAVDVYQGECTTRRYEFTRDSNRTALTTYGPDAEGECQTGTLASSQTSSFDAADRITDAGYSYDKLGRTLTIPAGHTASAGGGDLAVRYFANDIVASLAQEVVEDAATVTKVQEFDLDVSGRLSTAVHKTDGDSLRETLNAYADEEDSPAWIETKSRESAGQSWDVTWTRYIGDLSDAMAITQNSSGDVEIQLANLHGDVAATMGLDGIGLDSFTDYTEYGIAREDTPRPADRAYGWHGIDMRSADTVGGLVLDGGASLQPEHGQVRVDRPGRRRHRQPLRLCHRPGQPGRSRW